MPANVMIFLILSAHDLPRPFYADPLISGA